MVFENSEISAFCVAPDHHQPESLTVFYTTGKSTRKHRPTSKSQHQHQHSKEENSTGEQGGDARGKEDEPKSMWGRWKEGRQAKNCEGLRSKKETLEEEMKRIEDDMEIGKCRREGVEEGGVLGVMELRRERIGKFL
jgi:hypothetical protein